MINNINCFLFDLDGTLVDTLKDITLSLNHTMQQLGRPAHTQEEVQDFVGGGVQCFLERALTGPARSLLDKAREIFIPYYMDHCADHAVLYSGVLDTLKDLADKSLAIVTNKPAEPSVRTLKSLKIHDLFREIIGGDDLPVRKPDPGQVLEALKRMNVKPEQAVMVGDSPGDIQSGKAAGVKTAAVTYGFRPQAELEDENPDFLLHKFSDLKKVVTVGTVSAL